MTTDSARMPTRHVTTIQKYRGDVDPDNPGADPFETIEIDHGWIAPDGTPITDPDVIRKLEGND